MGYRERTRIFEVQVHIHYVGLKAIKVSDTGDEEDAVWLPISQLGSTIVESDIGHIMTIVAPEWLLQNKGLI